MVQMIRLVGLIMNWLALTQTAKIKSTSYSKGQCFCVFFFNPDDLDDLDDWSVEDLCFLWFVF